MPSSTSLSLLAGIRTQDPVYWDRFTQLFGPLIYNWCRRKGLGEHDAADIVQDVFRVVFSKIDAFRRDKPGDSFRAWLWRITRNKVMDHHRRSQKNPPAVGGSTGQAVILNLAADWPAQLTGDEASEDANSTYTRALQLIQTEFEEHTWRAFWRVAIEDASPAIVSQESGMSLPAVYNAKYKVLRRLREEFAELL